MQKNLRKPSLVSVALRCLAVREHSAHELAQKLANQGMGAKASKAEISKADIFKVVAQLTEEGLQSDERYAAALIRSKLSRGYGPLHLQYQLKSQHIDPAIYQPLLTGIDWPAHIQQVCRIKYGSKPARTVTETARRARFLAARGFPFELIRTVGLRMDGVDDGA